MDERKVLKHWKENENLAADAPIFVARVITFRTRDSIGQSNFGHTPVISHVCGKVHDLSLGKFFSVGDCFASEPKIPSINDKFLSQKPLHFQKHDLNRLSLNYLEPRKYFRLRMLVLLGKLHII